MSNFLYAEKTVPPGIGMGSYSAGHIFWLILAAMAIYCATRYYKISDGERRRKMRRNIVIAMFADEALKWFVTIPTGQWNWAYLPLHLCSISMFVALLHYKTENPMSKEFRDLLDQCSVLQSFSAKGYPYDNSVCESFFKYLKMEETDRKHYRTREELRLDLFSYIDGYYNSKRIHSSISYKTPNKIEKEFLMINC